MIVINSHKFSFLFLILLKSFFETLENKHNITNLGYVFVSIFYIILRNFLGNWTNSFTIIALILFSKTSKKERNWCRIWEIHKFICYEMKKGYCMVFSLEFVNDLSVLLLYKLNILNIFNMIDFFRIFVI